MTPKKINFHLLLVLLSAGLFALLALTPRDWTTESSNAFNIESISILNPYVYNAMLCAAALLAIFMVFYAIKKKVSRNYKITLLVLSVLIYPASCTKSVLSNLGNWTSQSTITTDDGAIYHFLDSSFLQGQLMAIGKLSDNGLFFQKFDVLVMNNGDSPRSYSRIIRHEGAQNTYGQLYATSTGYLIGVRYENKSFLAYNTLTDKAYGHGDIEQLSPFIMLKADTKLNTDDIKHILEAGIGDMPGQPRLESVKAGLKHPNTQVRGVAKKLLENIKTEAKKETKTNTNAMK